VIFDAYAVFAYATMASPALACQCIPPPTSWVVEPPNLTLPSNGEFRIADNSEGELIERYHLRTLDASAEIDFDVEVMEGLDVDLVRLTPTEPLEEGESYVLEGPNAYQAVYLVGPMDTDPPVLDSVRLGKKENDKSTCDIQKQPYIFNPSDPQDDELTITYDLELDGYWFEPGLLWVDTCEFGMPLDLWDHEKEVFLLDWAGNESESVPLDGRVCGCQAANPLTSSPSRVWLLGLGLPARSSSPQC